jgi:hypothetical protein
MTKQPWIFVAATTVSEPGWIWCREKIALQNWEAFPPSSKRGILEWILNAKKIETRHKRIEETVRLAAENIRANHFRQ